MKIINQKPELWVVRWYHLRGYQAPDQFVEVTPYFYYVNKEKLLHPSVRLAAVKLAKQQSQLGKFPEKWYCKVTNVSGL